MLCCIERVAVLSSLVVDVGTAEWLHHNYRFVVFRPNQFRRHEISNETMRSPRISAWSFVSRGFVVLSPASVAAKYQHHFNEANLKMTPR